MRLIVLALVASCGFPKPDDVTGLPDAPPQEACCQLLASRPTLAKAGATLTLEGTFDPAATITFPGGETAPLTLLGPHRARVVVPASATAGDLTMMFEGAVVGTAPFRRITFTPSITRFESKDHQASGARQDVSLAQLRSGATATTVGRWLYVIGGTNAGTASNTVERSQMNADGTLGRFAIVPAVTLVTARSRHQTVVIGDFLYVIGGSDGTSSIASLERAPITDGAIGPFETIAGVALTTARAELTTAVIGNWLYAVGGTDGTQPLDTIERAYFAADGSIGTFEVADVTLMKPRKGHTSLATLDALYVFAGSDGQPIDTIERLPIDANGDLGAAMAPSAPNTLVARDRAVGMELEDSYCLFGGGGLTVECAAIATDGKLGPFISPATNATLRAPRVGPVAAVVGSKLFIIGGDGTTSVERTAIIRGQIGAFTTAVSQTTAMSGPGGLSTTVVGDSVYVLGYDNHERARVALDGTLGTFGPAPLLVVGTGMHSTVVIGDYLYVLGGFTFGPAQALSRVERALIKPDGSLDPFATVSGVTLAKRRYAHSSVVLGNNLYVIGGVSISGTGLNQVSAFEGSIERATINADGSISTFAPVAGIAFSPRGKAGTAVIDDAIYIVGGFNGANSELATVEHIEFNPDGTLKTSTYNDLPLATARISPSLAVMGSYLWVFGGDAEFPIADNLIERASIAADGQVSAFSQQPAMLLVDRYGASGLVLGNHLYLVTGTGDRSVEQAELQ